MQKQSLVFSLHQIGAIQFGEFILKSGQSSSFYINLRKIISYPALLREIATIMWTEIKNSQFDLVCGVPYTALPIATCLSLDQNIPMIMRRKEKKDYGTKQMIEGEFQAGQTCLIIEDIITTGSSILETAQDLQQAHLNIQHVIALIDREQGGKSHLETQFKTHTVLTLSEIFLYLLNSDRINAFERQAIEKIMQEKMIA